MASEVVAVFARWWDNFQESCDIRLAVGCGCAVAWVLLVAGWAAPFGAVRLSKRVVGMVASVFTGGALYIVIALLSHSIAFALSLALAPASLFFAMLIGRFPDLTVVGEIPAPQEDISEPLHPACPMGPELSLAAVVYGALFALAGHTLPGIENAWLASTLPGLVNVGVFLASETILTLYMVKRVRHELSLIHI